MVISASSTWPRLLRISKEPTILLLNRSKVECTKYFTLSLFLHSVFYYISLTMISLYFDVCILRKFWKQDDKKVKKKTKKLIDKLLQSSWDSNGTVNLFHHFFNYIFVIIIIINWRQIPTDHRPCIRITIIIFWNIRVFFWSIQEQFKRLKFFIF